MDAHPLFDLENQSPSRCRSTQQVQVQSTGVPLRGSSGGLRIGHGAQHRVWQARHASSPSWQWWHLKPLEKNTMTRAPRRGDPSAGREGLPLEITPLLSSRGCKWGLNPVNYSACTAPIITRHRRRWKHFCILRLMEPCSAPIRLRLVASNF